MEFILTLLVIAIGITYMRKLERKIKTQDDKIFTLEQLLNMNLVKDGKEESQKTEAGKAESKA